MLRFLVVSSKFPFSPRSRPQTIDSPTLLTISFAFNLFRLVSPSCRRSGNDQTPATPFLFIALRTTSITPGGGGARQRLAFMFCFKFRQCLGLRGLSTGHTEHQVDTQEPPQLQSLQSLAHSFRNIGGGIPVRSSKTRQTIRGSLERNVNPCQVAAPLAVSRRVFGGMRCPL